jgi:transposase
MRKTKEILRHKWQLRRSHRDIAKSLEVSLGSVGTTVARAQQAGLSWEQVCQMPEPELEQRLYGRPSEAASTRPEPDCHWIHRERRRVGVTLELLHEEYLGVHPDGYKYTQFCERYRQFLSARRLTMRQVHIAGQKMFVDYAGKKPHLVDRHSGQRSEVELFVAVLGASNYTYAEATLTQQGPDFIASHVRAYEYFGGVARDTVCDQLRSGVQTPCRYEPKVQRTYEQMAEHYGTTVLPARPAHPRDKAKVEVGVQISERWLLGRLRNQTFFELEELNEQIWLLLEPLNQRLMRVYRASRLELFKQLDQPALQPLPPERFVYCQWLSPRVNIDYHVELDHHYYSVPHALVHQKLDARLTSTTVELYHHNQRVALHLRSYKPGQHTTEAAHMPKAHQKHLEWSPTRILHWASTVGPHTQKLVQAIMQERPHPEQGYRSCLGILRLGKRFTDARLEAACARALEGGARSYRHVESILKNGLDRVPLTPTAAADSAPKAPVEHSNVRGRSYYH